MKKIFGYLRSIALFMLPFWGKVTVKTMKYGLILFLLVPFACSKDNPGVLCSSQLKGKWIETEIGMDTLSFESLDHMEIMNLNRGKETTDGSPKYKSGPYQYKLVEKRISLKWMLSSDSNFNDYYFEIMGNSLKIGNFYGSTLGDSLTFERLD